MSSSSSYIDFSDPDLTFVSRNKFQSVKCEHNSTGRYTHLDNNSPGVSNFIVDKPDNDYTSFPSNLERNDDDNQSCLLLSKKRKVKMKVNESESKSKIKGGCNSKMKKPAKPVTPPNPSDGDSDLDWT